MCRILHRFLIDWLINSFFFLYKRSQHVIFPNCDKVTGLLPQETTLCKTQDTIDFAYLLVHYCDSSHVLTKINFTGLLTEQIFKIYEKKILFCVGFHLRQHILKLPLWISITREVDILISIVLLNDKWIGSNKKVFQAQLRLLELNNPNRIRWLILCYICKLKKKTQKRASDYISVLFHYHLQSKFFGFLHNNQFCVFHNYHNN